MPPTTRPALEIADALGEAYGALAAALSRLYDLPRSEDTALANRIRRARANIEQVQPFLGQRAEDTPAIRPNRLPVETLFTTRHVFDAGLAGFDGPTEPADGGFEVAFDGRHGIPSVTIYGQEGEVTVCGAAAIRQLADAMLSAEKAAARMVA